MSNVIPEGWSNKTLSDLAILQYGKSPKEVMCDNGEYPVIGTGGITGYASNYLHEGNTTVIGRKGTINSPSFITEKFWAIDTTYIATDYKEADPKWFYYSLNNIDLKKYNEASGVPSLNRDTLYSIQIKRPPLPEQQKIAAILSSVDEVIEKTQAQIEKLKDLKIGMMQELLSPRESKAGDQTSAQASKTNGLHHTEFKDSPLGRIPAGWEVVSVGTVADVIDPQPDHRTPPEVEGGIPYIGLGDINKSGLINFSSARKVSLDAFNKQLNSFEIHPKAFIFGKIGTIGNPSILPERRFYCLSANIILITTSNLEMMEYLYQVFTSGVINQQVAMQTNTTSQPALGIKKVRDFLIPIPSDINEQKIIVNTLSSIDKKIVLINEKLMSLNDTKKALMQDLLTGKVRVSVN